MDNNPFSSKVEKYRPSRDKFFPAKKETKSGSTSPTIIKVIVFLLCFAIGYAVANLLKDLQMPALPGLDYFTEKEDEGIFSVPFFK